VGKVIKEIRITGERIHLRHKTRRLNLAKGNNLGMAITVCHMTPKRMTSYITIFTIRHPTEAQKPSSPRLRQNQELISFETKNNNRQ